MGTADTPFAHILDRTIAATDALLDLLTSPQQHEAVAALLTTIRSAESANVYECLDEAANGASGEQTTTDADSPFTLIYRCPACGGTDVEGTTWIHLNSGKDTGGEPPSDDYWCPDCEDHYGRVECVEAGSDEERELLEETRARRERNQKWREEVLVPAQTRE